MFHCPIDLRWVALQTYRRSAQYNLSVLTGCSIQKVTVDFRALSLHTREHTLRSVLITVAWAAVEYNDMLEKTFSRARRAFLATDVIYLFESDDGHRDCVKSFLEPSFQQHQVGAPW